MELETKLIIVKSIHSLIWMIMVVDYSIHFVERHHFQYFQLHMVCNRSRIN